MDELVNYCKQYGIIFQGSEIYGGLANTWDYGPVGVLIKNNVKNAWLKKFIQEDINNVGLDSACVKLFLYTFFGSTFCITDFQKSFV